MKNYVVVILSLFVFSCSKEETGFKGFGDLTLGADFASVRHADKFETMAPDEFFIPKYELSEELGSVQKVYVTTLRGKIAEVKFNTDRQTNLEAVAKAYSDLHEYNPGMPAMPNVKLDFFIAKDSSVMLAVHKNPPFSDTGKNHFEFIYVDKERMEAQSRKLKAKTDVVTRTNP